MEQEEKKKRKKYRRRRQSKSTSSFPPDLTSEILSRLPARSVVRFRCVSKLWSSITADSYFINSFETQSLRRPSLLLCFRKYENMFVSSISNRSYSSSQPIDRYHTIEIPKKYSRFPPTESVHGLICFQEYGKPVVWNPSKRQFLTLPKPRDWWEKITVLLGYDPIDGKHKVVSIPFYQDCDVCRVLTLGSAQESWRTVRTNHKHRSYMHTSGRYVKGVIYYLAYSSHTLDLVLMSFDVRSEKFDMRALPSDIRSSKLINYGGRLACVDKNNGGRLWILEDAEKDEWSLLRLSCTFWSL